MGAGRGRRKPSPAAIARAVSHRPRCPGAQPHSSKFIQDVDRVVGAEGRECPGRSMPLPVATSRAGHRHPGAPPRPVRRHASGAEATVAENRRTTVRRAPFRPESHGTARARSRPQGVSPRLGP
jgi:hypothetical protein